MAAHVHVAGDRLGSCFGGLFSPHHHNPNAANRFAATHFIRLRGLGVAGWTPSSVVRENPEGDKATLGRKAVNLSMVRHYIHDIPHA